MRTCDGVIFVYAIDNRLSFEQLNYYREKIIREKESDSFTCVVCASKCDLESARQVSKSEGKELAKKWNALYYETSALQKINIREMFFDLFRKINTVEAVEKPKQQHCNIS
eukprot:TRINITY_DN6147_c0_g1_i2.p1 TRINITY_DN6147_c0_g1~~TRINITY_DN6147_c0_g1_i2.p1  ORF type:complete len:111 (+),score=12.62 TRINITY_DN6147_c0_g1_i2:275-607(+)